MSVRGRDRLLRWTGLWLLVTGIAAMFSNVPALDVVGALAIVLGLGLGLGVGDHVRRPGP